MPSTYTRLNPVSGSGNQTDDGHRDAIVEVIQRDNNGLDLSVQNERNNPISVEMARIAAGSWPGLDEDRFRVEPYQGATSALRWIFYFSNDQYFQLGTLGQSEQAVIQGTFNQTPVSVKRAYPALLKSNATVLGGILGVQVELPMYRRVVLDNVEPETNLSWQVKAVSDSWNNATASDIAERRGTIHVISGNVYMFNGTRSVRKRSDSLYEINYEWIIDTGTGLRSVSSDQPDADYQLILPPIVASGDPALSMPGGLNLEGDKHIRLPYHAVTIGEPTEAGTQPPFLQFPTATFDPSKYNDWTLLPGDPVNTV